MRILGIETSCDETAAAVVEGDEGSTSVRLISNVVTSSISLHAKTGGIIPEVAAREQVKYIISVIKEALGAANFRNSPKRVIPKGVEKFRTTQRLLGEIPPLVQRTSNSVGMTGDVIDAIAVTIGPGLIGSLIVGVETAKTLAYVWNKPIIPVNHLVGHIYANFIQNVILSEAKDLARDSSSRLRRTQNDKGEINFPALTLIVSGGHTDLVLMKSHGKFRWIGGTRDDAAGEAFDKIGRLLGLGYPGGPAIAAAAAKFEARLSTRNLLKASSMKFKKLKMLPRPMIDEDNFDFSFSGLKTAVMRYVKDPSVASLSQDNISSIAAEVQQAIVDVLVAKTIKAAQKYQVKSILLGGGVAANDKLGNDLQLNARRYRLAAEIFVPVKKLCTDNAAMIASAAFFNYQPVPWRKIKVDPSLHF